MGESPSVYDPNPESFSVETTDDRIHICGDNGIAPDIANAALFTAYSLRHPLIPICTEFFMREAQN
jgi:hypothetical protein